MAKPYPARFAGREPPHYLPRAWASRVSSTYCFDQLDLVVNIRLEKHRLEQRLIEESPATLQHCSVVTMKTIMINVNSGIGSLSRRICVTGRPNWSTREYIIALPAKCCRVPATENARKKSTDKERASGKELRLGASEKWGGDKRV